ncbi:APC family permease [Virgibacillus halodenitrificans]|jgi:amino acid transporter|uniref:APC family permease n=1 Tax=Virgibacillus halodenitrificans TaxID=1482 RepID=A0ABR7VMV8_VIRHA|nr:APC family permease [Virgibacillus halodenitrificans]MBD1222168.1 APC family permease [Virgibacillus halodenitrificans]MEC2160968.1 APC family permease [Virgibacillus halodenitrificans]
MAKREQLERTLKPQWVWAIAFGSAVGWGAFVLPVDWMSMAGPLGVILGFMIGAILMIIIGVSYGFLVEKLPVSGGEFAYAYYGLGRYHAFLCGWFLTLGYMSIVALNASALALLGKFVLPSIVEQGFMYNIAGWEVYAGEVIVACLALIVFAFLNIRGASLSGLSQYIFCLILIVGVVLLTIGMVFHPSSSFSNMQPLFKPGIGAVSSIIAIVAIAPWAYIGFDNIPQAAEEFNFSPKKSFKLIVIALICAGLTYSMTVMATGVGQPWTAAMEEGSVWGTGTIVQNAFGTGGLVLLSFALLMGVFTGLNGFYMTTSRLLFAMGRAKVLPNIFSKLHPKHNTPHIGILFTLALTIMAPFFGREALLWVVDMSALGVTIAYFYACFVAYKLFKWNDKKVPNERPFMIVAPGRKFLSLLGTICSAAFFLLLVVPGSPGFLSLPSWIALFVWIGLGGIFFLVRFKSYRAVPKAEMDHLVLGDYVDEDPEKDSSHLKDLAAISSVEDIK